MDQLKRPHVLAQAFTEQDQETQPQTYMSLSEVEAVFNDTKQAASASKASEVARVVVVEAPATRTKRRSHQISNSVTKKILTAAEKRIRLHVRKKEQKARLQQRHRSYVNFEEMSSSEGNLVRSMIDNLEPECLSLPRPQRPITSLAEFIDTYQDQVSEILIISVRDKGEEHLPEAIIKLTSLGEVYLDGNQLREFPPQLIPFLKQLEYVSLDRNPIRSITAIIKLLVQHRNVLRDEFTVSFEGCPRNDLTAEQIEIFEHLGFEFSNTRGEHDLPYLISYNQPDESDEEL